MNRIQSGRTVCGHSPHFVPRSVCNSCAGWKMKIGLTIPLLLFAPALMLSQAPPTSSEPSGAPPATVAGTPTSAIAPDLDRLQAVASQANTVIGRLGIQKWKTSSEARSTAQADADSAQRNLKSALPVLIDAVRSAPGDVNAEFKLYRNLNALYDVFGTLTEATRVFGQKGDYAELSQQSQTISSIRRKLGENLEQLTATTQKQLDQMRLQIKSQQEQLASAQAAAAEARKQVELAQAEPPKKTATKKKAVAKKPTSATSGSNVNSSGSNTNGQPAAVTTTPKS